MKKQFKRTSIALSALLFILIIVLRYVDSEESPEEFCEMFLQYSADRNYEKIASLIHPDLIDYYEQNKKGWFPNLFVYSIAASVPEGAHDVRITKFRLMEREEIIASGGDNFIYEYVPSGFKDLFEVKFSFHYGNTGQDGAALFLTKYKESYRIIVPDLADTAVWRKYRR